MLITLEGPEGSGKSSQLPLLAEFLRQQGYIVHTTREPGGTPIGDQVREILTSMRNTGMNARAETLLFCAARAQLVAEVIRPCLARLTPSEFCTILTAGMATVASSTMGLYVLFLKDVFPGIAGHLMTASVLSAPAALVMAKLIMPEDGVPATLGLNPQLEPARDAGSLDAVINGAMAGMQMVLGIVALLIAFLILFT